MTPLTPSQRHALAEARLADLIYSVAGWRRVGKEAGPYFSTQTLDALVACGLLKIVHAGGGKAAYRTVPASRAAAKV